MKKFLRITAALAAVFAMVNFVACKDDDDDDGDEGNGFENTYWVLEDIVDEDDGYTLTSSAVSYVHIKDGTTGTIYETSDDTLEQADTELITGGVTASKEVAYDATTSFTYAIDGSAIKIKYKDETGKDVSLNVTVAEDKNSFSYTEGEGEDAYTLTYTKVSEAPKAAKVTYTVKIAEPGTDDPATPDPDPIVPADPVIYSFESGITADDVTNVGLAYNSAKQTYDTPAVTELTEKLLANGATIGWKGSSTGTLRFRAANEDPAVVTAVNYNGGSKTDNLTTGVGTPDRYVKVPVKANQTITVTYKVVTSSSATGDVGQIGLFDDSGAVVGTVTEGLKLKTGDGSKETLTATAAADGNVKVVFSRNNAGGGGVDIYSIKVE